MGARDIAVIVHGDDGQPLVGATVAMYSRVEILTTDERGIAFAHNVDSSVEDICVKVIEDGYDPYLQSPLIPTASFNLGIGIPVGPTDRSLPPVHKTATPIGPSPSRETVCGVNVTFQGLTVDTTQFGTLPWFEPAFSALSLADRKSVYRAKHAAGDTHVIIEFNKGGAVYDSTDEQPYKYINAPDFEAFPTAFRHLVEEILTNGFIPGVVFDGDNGDNPVDGHPNAMRQLPILARLLEGLHDRVLYLRFWDGVFYGSSIENIMAFGAAFRNLIPNGYLGIEHNPGHIPLGEGGDDYHPGGRMKDYDVIFSEFEDSSRPDQGNDTIWQIVGRMIHPYHRPADQVGDPTPPFYLVDSPRGPRFYCAFEFNSLWGAYAWVRGRVSAADITTHRQYFKSLGCKYTG